MGKVTFVVEYEDGKEPAVNGHTEILGGRLCRVAWLDVIALDNEDGETANDGWNSVLDCLPPANTNVLLFDSGGEGLLIGWRSLWYGPGQVETGEWEWSFQIEGMTDLDITHWAAIPEVPEAL
jgi:hypothetical protein